MRSRIPVSTHNTSKLGKVRKHYDPYHVKFSTADAKQAGEQFHRQTSLSNMKATPSNPQFKYKPLHQKKE